MDILTNMGLLALFQYAKASKKGFQHASRKNYVHAISLLLRLGGWLQGQHVGWQCHVRHGSSCHLSLTTQQNTLLCELGAISETNFLWKSENVVEGTPNVIPSCQNFCCWIYFEVTWILSPQLLAPSRTATAFLVFMDGEKFFLWFLVPISFQPKNCQTLLSQATSVLQPRLLQETSCTPRWSRRIVCAGESAICVALKGVMCWVTLFSRNMILPEIRVIRLVRILRITYLIKRGVYFVIENPSTSLLWRYKCVKVSQLMFTVAAARI